MTTAKKHMDRRTRRTRLALLQAFREVVREKGFAATSVQEVTERANINRGTFYLHFTDKYMLVDVFLREHFQDLLSHTLSSTARWDRKSLRLLIETLLKYFESKYHHERHLPQAIAPLVEQTIHDELSSYLLIWLRQSPCDPTQWRVPMEVVARIVSWAIFGTVLQWSQEESTASIEQMTNHILFVVLEGVAHLAPLPE
ncbi:TetR family transcriptional regulator [Reticulibacter mediterranei]|uniref:TetR family transcriptional regulator n=1 Tax=Reticulibacter mediterranei TaxID=2778369 RepID=A0A8J3ISJ0_9CHLR|nr:TetR/AcrR family transcriptional regulator [Reticulibacter mediterranei]GHO97813.1 TetR family transcriptional regulator [Reticulibacter mediterranei]